MGNGEREVYPCSRAFRMTEAMEEKILKFASDMRTKHPGVKITDGDAMRVLITKGLEAIDGQG